MCAEELWIKALRNERTALANVCIDLKENATEFCVVYLGRGPGDRSHGENTNLIT